MGADTVAHALEAQVCEEHNNNNNNKGLETPLRPRPASRSLVSFCGVLTLGKNNTYTWAFFFLLGLRQECGADGALLRCPPRASCLLDNAANAADAAAGPPEQWVLAAHVKVCCRMQYHSNRI